MRDSQKVTLFVFFAFLKKRFINLKKNKFIYFRLPWVFIAAHRLSLVAVSTVAARGLLIAVASLVVEHGLWSAGSVVVVHGHLPRPGLEPVSPALAGGFLTTAPPGKPCTLHF